MEKATFETKVGLAEMLKGGVIMDVTNAEQAKIAEDAGAVAVMALERVPADIRRDGGVARMSDPEKIIEIMEAVTIPVMAKVRIGHFVVHPLLRLHVVPSAPSSICTPESASSSRISSARAKFRCRSWWNSRTAGRVRATS